MYEKWKEQYEKMLILNIVSKHYNFFSEVSYVRKMERTV